MPSVHDQRAPERWMRLAAGLFLAIGLLLQNWRIWSLNATYDQGLFLQEIWNGHLGRPFESTLAPTATGLGDPRAAEQHPRGRQRCR